MSFELLQTHCLSVFTVTIQTLGTFTFNVKSEEIGNGNARFSLPLSVSLMEICSSRGVIFGGNDAGNSTTADIQLPSGEDYYILQRETLLMCIFTECHPSTVKPSSTPPPPTIPSPSSSGVSTTIIAGFCSNNGALDHRVYMCFVS